MISGGSPYEKRIDAKGRMLSDKCIADEVPFDIPESWVWARLESVTSYIQRGKSPKYSMIEKYPVVAQKCNQWSGFSLEKAKFVDPGTVEKYGEERVLKDGDLLWNSTGLGTLGRMVIYDSKANKYGWAVADSHVTVIRTCGGWLDFRYAYAYFAGPSVQTVIEDQASGSTKQKELAQETVRQYLIPLPPLPEQLRIVERVDGLMPLVEEYGKLEDAREELDTALPGRLRKSVLQEAVRGRLVPQDHADEPADILLERIRGQRRQLVAEKKMKAPKGGESVIFTGSDGRRYEKRVDVKGRESEPVCIEDEIPFDIPDTWAWTRLGSLITLLSGTDLKPVQYNDKGEGIPYLTGASNFSSGRLIENRWTVEPSRISHKGELLFTCKGTVGEMALNSFAEAHIARQIMAISPDDTEMLSYLTVFLRSMVETIKARAKGVIPGIERMTLLGALVPVPPLSEQRRIALAINSVTPHLTNQ